MKELDLSSFPKVSKSDWIDLAKNQLKGDDPQEQLNWIADANLEMNAYYDASDIEALNEQVEFFKSLKPFHWKLYETIAVNDEKLANKKALEALGGGCDGVIFDINIPVDFEKMLNEILTEICDVSILSNQDLRFQAELNGFIHTKTNSSIFIISEGQSQVENLVQLLNEFSSEQHILRKASSDFFLEIASIRSLRYLLSDILGKSQDEFQIHTTVPLHEQEDQQWVLNSTHGLASILGGTTSINFATAQGDSRISRNVGNLIREESDISQYSDQCGGAFYIETLTHQIIQACKNKLRTKHV